MSRSILSEYFIEPTSVYGPKYFEPSFLLFLDGKTGTLIRELGQKMTAASQNENFEEASILRNRIQSLEVYTSKQKVISNDFSDKDVINYVCEGDDACAMILNIRDGKVVSKRHFYLDTVEDKSESEIIERVLFTYYSENNYIPDEIHLPLKEAASFPRVLEK